MSGPRLQASLFEGFETRPALSNSYSDTSYYPSRIFFVGNSSPDTNLSNGPETNALQIRDLVDGRQLVDRAQPSYFTYLTILSPCRYALKTTTPNTYLVFTQYAMGGGLSWTAMQRCEIGKGAWPTLGSSQTLSVELNTSKYRAMGGGILQARSSSSTNTWKRIYGTPYYIYNSPADEGNWVTDSNIRVGTTVSGTQYTLTVTFPADAHTVLLKESGNYVNIFPLGLEGRKIGDPRFDSINIRSKTISTVTQSYYYIGKVYSPFKNCLCLKSYLQGEIPILNE